MSIDETEVTQQANGVAHKRVRLDPAPGTEQVTDQAEQAPVSTMVNTEPEQSELITGYQSPDSPAEPRRGAVAFVKDAATHQYVRFALRHGAYVATGVHVAAKKTWDARTTTTHQKAIDAARIKGDHESMLQWTQEAARFREQRHKRRMELLSAPYHLVKGTVFGGALTVGGLVALGVMLAIVNKNPRNVFAPLMDAMRLVKFVWTVCGYLYLPVALALPALLIAWLWANGRNKGNVPNWLVPAAQRARDQEVITPSAVVKALRDLGVAKLTGAIKEMADGAASMLGSIVLAGCGVEVDVMLPSGISTADIQARRKRLAENLGRHEHELFISIPRAARTVRLWIADCGALEEPIGPSPLVIDPDLRSNYRSGRAPWGVNLRGDRVLISLFQRHLLITGLSNQGKTASLRALVLWLALDVMVDFWLADLKGVGDWKCMEGIAAVFIEGPTDEHACAATEMLERGVTEMERRLQAPAGTKFRPLILVVDEAQNAYMNPTVGPDKRPYGGQKATSRYFMAVRKLHNQGRAVDVLLYEGTQDPTDRNLPKLAREGAHIRAGLVLGTESQSRMALGDSAVDAGAAPHELRQGLDKGTLVLVGDAVDRPVGQISTTLRTHYIDDDAAILIGDHARALRAGRGREQQESVEGERDMLADIREVCGDETRVRTSVVLQRLAVLDERYEGFTGEQLKAFLAPLGAAPHKYNGHPVVTTARVQAALDDRELDDDETENDDS